MSEWVLLGVGLWALLILVYVARISHWAYSILQELKTLNKRGSNAPSSIEVATVEYNFLNPRTW